MRTMMQRYEISKQAEKDLRGIWKYTVDAWSREQANKYLQGIFSALNVIAMSPSSVGRPYDHVRVGYRKYQVGKHVVFYQVKSNGIILINRVLHEKMDYDNHL